MNLQDIGHEEAIEWYCNVDGHGRCEVHMASFVSLDMVEEVIVNTAGLGKDVRERIKSDIKGFLGRDPKMVPSAEESEKMQREKFGLLYSVQNCDDDSDDASNDSEDDLQQPASPQTGFVQL